MIERKGRKGKNVNIPGLNVSSSSKRKYLNRGGRGAVPWRPFYRTVEQEQTVQTNLFVCTQFYSRTSMHSGRMRTAACYPYLPAYTAPGGSAPGVCLLLGGLLLGGLLLGGCSWGVYLWGVCLRSGGVSKYAMGRTPPPANRILDTRF